MLDRMTAYRAARHAFLLALIVGATAVQAQETVVSLSPAEKDKILDAAASRPKPAGELPVNGLGVAGQVHGEVGMFVGTGGARGVYGTAVAPVGESGQIGIAFENSRFGRR